MAAPLLSDDAAALLAYAFSGSLEAEFAAALLAPLQPVADVLLDEDGAWQQVFAGTIADDRLLAWGAMWAGADEDTAATRDLDLVRNRWRRGTPAAIRVAARETLTGTQRVILRERFDPDNPGDAPWHLQVKTYTSETPDADATERAILAQKPGGMVLHFSVLDGLDWQQVFDGYASWTSVFTAYDSWTELADDTP